MDTERFRLVRELFHELADLTEPERRTILDERKIDPEVRAELTRLIELEAEDGGCAPLSDEHIGEVGLRLLGSRTSETDGTPDRIGSFRIRRRIGEGSMGVVYAAQRDESQDTVALKVIRHAMDSERLAGRFRREAAVLRQLRHRGIAAFYEAGTVTIEGPSGGRASVPYLAMELVDGEPLTRFAASRGLSSTERMELFARVCDAVDHAHGAGVIHRDLKPANILVAEGTRGGDELGQPKVLDFGVARAVDLDLNTVTETETGMVMGTLPYMSPEQVSGAVSELEARSDVYSLGVILYELLAGRLPYDVRGRTIPEAARVICEEEPTRLGSLLPEFRTDVEVVVSKALEKDPEHRYATAAELASDLRRATAGEPVQARRASFLRQTRKFARRHRALVAGVAGTIVALSVGLVTTLLFALRASRAAEEFEHLAYRARVKAAGLALDLNRPEEARRYLQAIPQESRGWEWEVLSGSLEGSLAVFSEPPRSAPNEVRGSELQISPDGETIYVLVNLLDQVELASWTVSTGERTTLRTIPRKSNPVLGPLGKWVYWVESDSVYAAPLPAGELQVLASAPGEMWFVIPSTTPDNFAIQSGKHVAWVHRNVGGPLQEPMEIDAWFWAPVALSLGADRVAWVNDSAAFVRDVAHDSSAVKLGGNHLRDALFGPLGKLLARYSREERIVELWDLSGEAPTFRLTHSAHTDGVHDVAFSPDGLLAASAGDDQTVLLWETEQGLPRRTLIGHTAPVHDVEFFADSRLVASSDRHGEVRLWPADGSDLSRIRHPNYVYSVRFDPSGSRFYSACWDGRVRVLDAVTGRVVAERLLAGGEPRLYDIAVHPGGRWIAYLGSSANEEGEHRTAIEVLNVWTGELLAVPPYERHETHAISLAVSSDGNRLFALSRHGPVHVWDTRDWSVVELGSDSDVRIEDGLAVHPTLPLLAACGERGIRLIDMETLDLVAEHPSPDTTISALAFGPKGEELAAGTLDSRVLLLDSRTLELRAELTGHTAPVFDLAYSPDGSRLVSGSGDRTIRVWDPEQQVELTVMSEHDAYVYRLGFDREGQRLVTASGDRSVRIWDSLSAQERHQADLAYDELQDDLTPWVEDLLTSRGAEAAAQEIQIFQRPDRERDVALQILISRTWAANR